MHNILDKDYLRGLINDLAVLGEVDAHELADAIIELFIATLARDPAIPPRTYSDWWAFFAPARARIVELLNRRINGHVYADDVLRAFKFDGAWQAVDEPSWSKVVGDELPDDLK